MVKDTIESIHRLSSLILVFQPASFATQLHVPHTTYITPGGVVMAPAKSIPMQLNLAKFISLCTGYYTQTVSKKLKDLLECNNWLRLWVISFIFSV